MIAHAQQASLMRRDTATEFMASPPPFCRRFVAGQPSSAEQALLYRRTTQNAFVGNPADAQAALASTGLRTRRLSLVREARLTPSQWQAHSYMRRAYT
jgi:hypothetical protein